MLHRYRRGHGFKSCTGLIFFFTPCFHYCSSSVHYCKDRFHIHVFIRSSHMLFLYIYSHLFITLRVYMEPTYYLAPSWLVSSVGRVLHRYRIGHGFKSCTCLIFFFTPCFHYCSSSVHYCKDRFHIHVFIRSSHMLFLYIYSHSFITLRVYMEPTY